MSSNLWPYISFGNEKVLLDKKSPIPIHTQMEEYVRQKLSSGEWPASYMLPSENEMCLFFDVSRMTVRSVITKFVQEGLIYRIPGKGTYVSSSKIEAQALAYTGIREQLEKQGFEASTRLLSAEQVSAPVSVSQYFQSTPEEQFYKIVRLRYIKNIPFSIHTSYVPAKAAPGLDKKDLENTQLCYILSRDYGLNRGKTIETLESIAAKPAQTKLLSVSAKSPLLLLHDTISTPDGIVFEVAEVLFKGDMIKLSFEF